MTFVVVFTVIAYLIEVVNGPGTQEFNEYVELALGSLLVGQTIWLILLLIAQSDSGVLTFELPVHLTRLPINARKLAGARMAFVLGSNVVLTSAGFVLYLVFFEMRLEEAMAYWNSTLGLAMVYAFLQSIAWWLGPTPIAPALGTIMCGWIVLVVHAAHFRYEPIWEMLFAKFNSLPPEYAAMTAIAIIIVSFGVGTCGIAQHRKERFAGLRDLLFSLRADRSMDAALSSSFSSPEDAIRWLEYRRNWKVFPWLMGLMFFSFLFPMYFITADIFRNDNPPGTINHALIGASVLAAYGAFSFSMTGMIGIVLYRLWRCIYNRDDAFLFFQPATTGELVNARWKANMRYVLSASLPLGILFVVATFFNDYTINGVTASTWGHFAAQQSAMLTILMYVSVGVLVCLAIWTALTPEIVAALILVSGLAAIPISGIGALADLGKKTSQYETWINVGNIIAYVSLIVMAVGVVWIGRHIFTYVRKNDLLQKKPVMIVGCLFPIAGVGVFFMANLDRIMYQDPLEYWGPLLLVAICFFAVFGPIVTTPALTHWNRHRK